MFTAKQVKVDVVQGTDDLGRSFGYVHGAGGGYFFTWYDTLSSILESVEEDEVDGNGGLSREDVRDFLRRYLPGTPRGRKCLV